MYPRPLHNILSMSRLAALVFLTCLCFVGHAKTNLTDDEIKRMQKEAELHKADDEKKKRLVIASDPANGEIYTIEKTLKENGDKIEAATKKDVEDALAEARKHLDSKDADEIKKATETLTAASNKMAEQMYKQAGAQAGTGPEANGPQGGAEGEKKDDKKDGVIDADFKEV